MENWEDNYKKVETSWEDNYSVFTDEKIDVALLVPAQEGDNTAGLGLELTKISDKDATIGSEGNRFFTPNVSKLKGDTSDKFTLPGLLNHSELYKRHPDVKNVKIEVVNDDGNFAAMYYPMNDSIKINKRYITNRDELRTALLHEVQHRIDFRNTSRMVKDGELKKDADDNLTNWTQESADEWNSDKTEAFAEVTEDNKYIDSTGKNVSENFLVTPHLKRLYRKYTKQYIDSKDDEGNYTDTENKMWGWTTANPPDGPPAWYETQSRKRLDELITEIAEVESHTKNVKERTGTTSASGFFQFVKGSAKAAATRTKKYFGNLAWLDEVEKTGEVMNLSYEQQKLLVIGDLLEKKGSDEYFYNLFTAKTSKEVELAKRNIYKDLHHTDVDKKDLTHRAAIYKNMNRVWNKHGYN